MSLPASVRRWLREPLVLFLLLGAAIFALDQLRQDPDLEGRRIDITVVEIERLNDLWSTQTGRSASPSELLSLIEDQVRSEILYREALRLGLDRDDTIVRRRLAQKLSFLMEDTARLPEPSDEELRRFFAAQTERYEEPARWTFFHIFVSAERRGEQAEEEATRLLHDLESASAASPGSAGSWRQLGDPFMLHREYAERSLQEIGDLFGQPFAQQFPGLPIGMWTGPVPSAYGLHLVRIVGRSEKRLPAFEEIRSRVLADLRDSRRSAANDLAYESLRRRYDVHIDDAWLAAGASADLGAER